MKKIKKVTSVEEYEKNLNKNNKSKYVLRLYVTGATPQSIKAVKNIKEICEDHLKNHYSLEIIDIYQQPILAEGDQIIAAPTLIKQLPYPLKKLIGDMSDTERVLVGLDLKPKK
ncbi:MAG TPA: circadian clock KaiB family protein [Candidatus Limnocylindrales bacterium]|nr:circadian clock KaiB family protein [Candidatus Limnocylindrales bacterium]